VIPLIIVAVLFYFTVVVQNNVTRDATGDELKVDVTAFQWNWEFAYPETRAPNGQPVSTVGTTSSVPILVLPTDRPIAFTQQSQDVIHSFWVPDFLFKRDVFPYPEANDQKNTWVIQRIDHPGAFVGRCAEFCGAYHSMMNFEVRALPPNLFDDFLRIRTQINPQTGQGYTTHEALATMNCGELCIPQAVTTHPFNPDPTARQAFK
jgi:cytochrome c oxidase subunit 2